MNYNLFISTQTSTYNILDINDDNLKIIIDAYKYGKDSVFLNGKKYFLKKLLEIVIFTFNHSKIKTEKELINVCEKNGKMIKFLGLGGYITSDTLDIFGENVTSDFITNEFGYLNDVRIAPISLENYVDINRIDEIEKIDDDDYDYTRLVAYLKELNVAYSHGLYLSIPPLVRAIIDHIPPIFEKGTFAEVCGSHGTRSFKDNMNNLNKSSRKIADSFLHSQIRKKEALPNATQINFKNDLDVLLQEIVRIKKK